MKRILFILFAIGLTTTTAMAAMNSSRLREDTRFLTDKMAYELRLSTPQYNDVYEINYDFIDAIGDLMQYVVRGDEWALDEYYEALDIRNDDLRWVLSESQYRRFLGRDYFYRPISATGRGWSFRIYINYTNRNLFYFGRPHHYFSYCGGHYRRHYHTVSYYRDRHTRFGHYAQPYRTRESRNYNSHRRSDFGSITMRPNSSTRPGNSVTRPGSSVTRPGSSVTTRPAPDRGHGSRNEAPARPNRDTDRRPDADFNTGRRPSNDRNNGNNRRESVSDRRSERSTPARSEVSSSRSTERSSSSESSRRSGRDNQNNSSRSSERGNNGRR